MFIFLKNVLVTEFWEKNYSWHWNVSRAFQTHKHIINLFQNEGL